jgi:hypothetical protein
MEQIYGRVICSVFDEHNIFAWLMMDASKNNGEKGSRSFYYLGANSFRFLL